MLERHLSARFGPVRSSRFNIVVPVSQLMLAADGNVFLVAFAREKRGRQNDSAWLLTINPLNYPVPLKKLPIDEERKYSKGLMLISGEIEALLTNTPAVAQQGWFFEGWEAKKLGVRTPAELPWHVDVPELSCVERRKSS